MEFTGGLVRAQAPRSNYARGEWPGAVPVLPLPCGSAGGRTGHERTGHGRRRGARSSGAYRGAWPGMVEGILAGRAKRGAGKILLDKSRIELVNGAMTYHASIAEGLAYYSRALTDMWPGKLACGALLTAAASFLDTDRALVLLVIGAMCVDLFFGLWVAFRRHRFRCGLRLQYRCKVLPHNRYHPWHCR